MSTIKPSHTAQTTTPAKTRHYVAVLSSALLRGGWADTVVGKDYKGRDMDWGELLRKWEKHGGNNPDLIHHLREISLLYLSHPSPSASGYITIPQPYGTSTASDATDTSRRTGASTGTGVSGTGTAASDGSFVHVHHPGSTQPSAPSSPVRASTVPSTPIRAAGQRAAQGAALSGSEVLAASTSISASRQTPGQGNTSSITTTPAQVANERASYLRSNEFDVDADVSDSSDAHDMEEAWRVGTQWWRGIPTSRSDEVLDGIRGLEALVMKGKLSREEKESAVLCWAYHLHGAGQFDGALKLYEEVDWSRGVNEGSLLGEGGRVDKIRGRCLQAMSMELIDPADPLALEYYLSCISFALPLLSLGTPAYLLAASTSSSAGTAPQSRRNTVSSMSTHSRMPTSTSTPSTASPLSLSSPSPTFEPLREIHRWLSTALSRAAILSARSSGQGSLEQTLRILRTYHLVSASYPPTFRAKERRRMLRLYLAALKLGRAGEWEKVAVPYLLPGVPTPLTAVGQGQGPGEGGQMTAKGVWKAEMICILRQGRDLLSTTTSFPRSGSRNTAVQAFVEDSVALALLADDATASSASNVPPATQIQAQSVIGEAINTLYWAQTITFNSQPILRHLTTLLAKQGEWQQAKRTFEAYRRLVRKEREAEGPEGAVMQGGEGHENAKVEELDEESDETQRDHRAKQEQDAEQVKQAGDETPKLEGDEQYARTLMLGARIIGRDLGEAHDGLEFVKEALELGKESDVAASSDTAPGKGISSDTRAAVERLYGVLEGKLAVEGTMPIAQRQALLDSAIEHLSCSTALSSSSLTSYHLARLYAITGQLDKATTAIRACLEAEDSISSTTQTANAAADDAENSINVAPESVAAWHLLALLRTADRDWEGALKACEAGIGAWEDGEDVWESVERAAQPDSGSPGGPASVVPSRKGSLAPSVAMSASTAKGAGTGNGRSGTVSSRDFGVTSSFSTLALNDQSQTAGGAGTAGGGGSGRRPSLVSIPERDWQSLVDEDGHLTTLSSSPSALQASSTAFALGGLYAQSAEQIRRERLQDVIALRQTAIVITEKRDGGEAALEQQRELFGFFKARAVPVPSGSMSVAGSRRQRSGTSGTMGTLPSSASLSASGADPGPGSQGLGLVGGAAASTAAPSASAAAGERLRGMTPINAREGENVETLDEQQSGTSDPTSIPSLQLPGGSASSGANTLTASPVSTLRGADGARHTGEEAASAALEQKPLAPILLGPPITSTAESSSSSSAPATDTPPHSSGNTIDLSDDGGPIHVSPLSVPSGLPNSTSAAEAISASAHGGTADSTSADSQGLGQGQGQAQAQALTLPIPLITESGASTPMASTHESSSGPNTRATNSPPSSVRFGRVDFAGGGSPADSPTTGNKSKEKSHTLGFGRLHVPLIGHHAGKQRAGTTQSGLGVDAGRGLASPSAPDLTVTRNNRITSQSSIALSTTSHAPSMFKRLRHPYATSTYAQSTTSKRRLAGRSKRQASGAASIASNIDGLGTPSSAGHLDDQRQSSPLSSPPPPSSGMNDPRHKGRTLAELRVLSDLWLASAAAYRRLGETAQARGAIQEAESYDAENPAVWVQLALCELAEAEELLEMQQEEAGLETADTRHTDTQRANGRFDRAIATLNKALALQADYLPAIMHLAKTYLVKAVSQSQAQLFAAQSQSQDATALSAGSNVQQAAQQTRQTADGDVAFCEALLNGAIEGVAWNCTEAYAMRAECRRLRGDEVGEREDLIKALEGEVGRGIRGWEVVRDWI